VPGHQTQDNCDWTGPKPSPSWPHHWNDAGFSPPSGNWNGADFSVGVLDGVSGDSSPPALAAAGTAAAAATGSAEHPTILLVSSCSRFSYSRMSSIVIPTRTSTLVIEIWLSRLLQGNFKQDEKWIDFKQFHKPGLQVSCQRSHQCRKNRLLQPKPNEFCHRSQEIDEKRMRTSEWFQGWAFDHTKTWQQSPLKIKMAVRATHRQCHRHAQHGKAVISLPFLGIHNVRVASEFFFLTVNESGCELFHRPSLASVFYLLSRKAAVTNYLLLFSIVMTPPSVWEFVIPSLPPRRCLRSNRLIESHVESDC